MRYWINMVSRAHVRIGLEGGFTQAGHGKRSGLQRLEKGDFIAFYSPRTELRGGEPLQAFTAIGRIADEEPYQGEMTPEFHPWRRRVAFFDSREVSIRPLVEELGFIRDKKRWGYPFRRGLFAIQRTDFEMISQAMNVYLKTEF